MDDAMSGVAAPEWPGMPDRDRFAYRHSMGPREPYESAAAAGRRTGVPAGALSGFRYVSEKAYSGAGFTGQTYVPAQYDGLEPVELMVFLDGDMYLDEPFSVPVVLDNLIAEKGIPPVIAVFVNPSPDGPGLPIYGGGGNRSMEYDSVTDQYVTFLIEELLPEVVGSYLIRQDSAWAICGISSSGNAAFTAAWHRPDRFGRVISHIGSFVNIRGGHQHESLVRRSPTKAIRVALQTGSRDLNTVFGDWRLANETLASALAYSGYDVELVVGEGGHTPHHGAAILPETLRWLWQPLRHGDIGGRTRDEV